MTENVAISPASADTLRALFDTSTQLIWLLTPDGTVRDLNRTVSTRAGATMASFVGSPLWNAAIWLPESSERLRAAFRDLDSDGTVVVLECRTLRQEPFWLELALKPLAGPQGTTELVIAEGNDITRRHQTLEQVIATEALLEEGQSLAKLGSWVLDIRTNSFRSSDSLDRLFGLDSTVKPMSAEEYQAAIFPEDREMLNRIAIDYVESGLTPEYDMRIRRTDGETRVLHGAWRAETDAQNKPVRFIGISQDVTEQRQLESRLARSVQRLSTLTAMAQSLTARWNHTGLYEFVNSMVGTLLQVETVILFIYEQGHLVIRAIDGNTSDPLVGQADGSEMGIAAHTWRSGEASVVRGADCRQRLNPAILDRLPYVPQVTVAVPMGWEDERVGVIKLLHSDPGAFSEEDIGLMQIVGAWLTIALINARLWEQQQRARQLAEGRREQIRTLARRIVSTQEAERQRFARELHDETGQVLTALKIKLSLLQNAVAEPAHRASLEEAKTMISDMMKNVRHIAHALRPPALDTFGLAASLEGLCRDIARHTDLQVTYEGEELPPCSDDVNIAIYRFVQEALTNIAKHAQAISATVRAKIADSTLIVEVSDNGRGFDSQQTSSGMGLLGMAERIEWLRGTFDVHSTIGSGTVLTAKVPL